MVDVGMSQEDVANRSLLERFPVEAQRSRVDRHGIVDDKGGQILARSEAPGNGGRGDQSDLHGTPRFTKN